MINDGYDAWLDMMVQDAYEREYEEPCITSDQEPPAPDWDELAARVDPTATTTDSGESEA